MSADATAAATAAGTAAATAARAPRLHTLQIGLGWQGEEAGGLNRYFAALAERLPAQGVSVEGLVAATRAPGTLRQDGGEVTARITAFASPAASTVARVLAARRAVRRAIAARRPDVLVSHFAPYGAALLPYAGRIPLVVQFHGPWADESRTEGRGAVSAWWRARLERTVYRRAARCIVLSEAFATLLQQRYGVPRERIVVIPGGVDVGAMLALPSRADARAALGWPATAPTVLAVRRLVRRTGIDRLLAAVPRLRAAVPQVQMMIAGDGPERAAYAARIADAGLDGCVRLLGFVPEERLALAYRAADLSVVPTVALEGFGLIVPESLAAGTPALVTPVGGLPETVRALDPQLVLRDSTPDAIADGLIAALRGVHRLPSADRCVAHARAHFDWTTIAAQVADQLRAVAA